MNKARKRLVTIVTCAGLSSVGISQDSIFTIQSFKPENIKDSQIQVTLYENYSESGGARDIQVPPVEEDQSSSFRNNLYTSVNWRVKYESPRILFYSNFNPSFSYEKNQSEYSDVVDDALPEQPINSYHERKSNSKRMDGRMRVAFLGSRYIINKFGLTGYSNMSFTMSKSDSYRKDEETDFRYDDYSTQLYERDYESEGKSSGREVRINGGVGPIYGRIYEGFYAAKAIELLSELETQGKVLNKPSATQLEQLSQIIYEEMNRYYFDSRIKRIETLERIITYLVSENIVDESTTTFLTILDIYQYSDAKIYSGRYPYSSYGIGQLYYRPTGFQISVLLKGAYNESNYRNKGYLINTSYRTYYDSLWQVTEIDTFDGNEPYEESRTSYGFGSKGVELIMNYSRPFGWRWHLVTGLRINMVSSDTTNLHWLGPGDSVQDKYYKSRSRRSRRRRTVRTNGQSTSINLQLQYFLNSRTKFEFNHKTGYKDMNYSHNAYQSVITDSGRVTKTIPYELDYKELALSIELRGTYYLTPRFSIRANCTYYFQKKWDVQYSSDHELFNSLGYRPENEISDRISFGFSVNYYLY